MNNSGNQIDAGGALHFHANSNGNIQNTTISNNTSLFAAISSDGYLTIINSIIYENYTLF